MGRQRYQYTLQKAHYRAVELRYEGLTYAEIKVQLKKEFDKEWADGTIRQWFMCGGLLEQTYLEYAERENAARQKMAMAELKKLMPLIPIKYRKLLMRKDGQGREKNDQVTAAVLKDLCNRMGVRFDDSAGSDPLDRFFDRLDQEDHDDTDHADDAGGGEASREAEAPHEEMPEILARLDDVPIPGADSPPDTGGGDDGADGDGDGGDPDRAAPAVR